MATGADAEWHGDPVSSTGAWTYRIDCAFCRAHVVGTSATMVANAATSDGFVEIPPECACEAAAETAAPDPDGATP